MRLLLDTHVLLWALYEPSRIESGHRAMIESAGNDVLFSAASIWEMTIKMQIGRLDLPDEPEKVAAVAVKTGFLELPVDSAHAAGVRRLPLHHRDPFDRLLLAQARHEPARFLTVDCGLKPYSDLVEIVS